MKSGLKVMGWFFDAGRENYGGADVCANLGALVISLLGAFLLGNL